MDRRNFIINVAASALIAPAAKATHSNEETSHNVSTQPTSHTFPPEWLSHDAVWMGWSDYVTRDEDHTKLRLDMLAALTPHVLVKMLVENRSQAQKVGSIITAAGLNLKRVQFEIQPTVDVWTRDCGPLFLTDGQTKQLAAFSWKNYSFPWPYTNPSSLARGAVDQEVGERYGLVQRSSDVVAEGGGLDVNSHSLVTYRDAMMDRNPGKTLDEIESELKRLYGKDQIIWLDRAPITDRVLLGAKIENFFGWGANGHVDEYVRFISDDTIFVGEVSEKERNSNSLMQLDYEILTENRRQLEDARTPDGKSFKIIPMPVPDAGPFMRRRILTEQDFQPSANGLDQRLVYRNFTVGDEIIEVPAVSYLNFLVTNGVVLSAKYGGKGRPEHLNKSDAVASALLQEAFPDRKIIQIDPLAANWDGGGMHCLTQQEPSL